MHGALELVAPVNQQCLHLTDLSCANDSEEVMATQLSKVEPPADILSREQCMHEASFFEGFIRNQKR